MNIVELKNPAIIKNRKKLIVIAGFIILFIIGIGIAVYPFFPMIEYKIAPLTMEIPGVPESQTLIEEEAQQTQITGNATNEAKVSDAGAKITSTGIDSVINLLIIPSIGVKIPIVEGTSEAVLNKGAWRLPETSTPDKGSNTVITGHRWKYRPPSEKTFYLLDKVVVGDIFKIIWQGKEYDYKVISTQVVKPTDVWVLNPTTKSTATLITCTPLFSTKNRLVVKGQLISK